jgi:hypothetical protein
VRRQKDRGEGKRTEKKRDMGEGKRDEKKKGQERRKER